MIGEGTSQKKTEPLIVSVFCGSQYLNRLTINRGLCCGLDCRRGFNIERTLRVTDFQHAGARHWPTFSSRGHFYLTTGLRPSRRVLGNRRLAPGVIRLRRVGPETADTQRVGPISSCPCLSRTPGNRPQLHPYRPSEWVSLPSRRGTLVRASGAHTEVISFQALACRSDTPPRPSCRARAK
jgi:hypothetical protein